MYGPSTASPSAASSIGSQSRAGLAEGIGRGAGGLLDLANMLLPPMVRPSQYLGEDQSFSGLGGSEALAATGGDPGAPQGALQGLARTATRGVGQAIPTLPLAGGAGAAGLELLSGATGELAGDFAKRAGAGPLGQFGASLLGGLAPGAIGGRIARRVGREGILDDNLATMEDALDRVFKSSDPVVAQTGWVDAAKRSAEKAKAAMQGVGNIQGIGVAPLKDAAASIRSDTLGVKGEVGKNLGRWLTFVEDDIGDATDLNTLRKLRSRLSQVARGAVRDPERSQELRWAEMLKQGVDDAIDTAAFASGTEDLNELRKALRAATDQYRTHVATFGSGSVGANLFKKFGGDNLGEGFRRTVMAAPDSPAAYKQLASALEDNPLALAGLQRLVRDEVFGNAFQKLETPGGIRAGMRALRTSKMSAVFDAAYGQGASKNAVQFFREVRSLSRKGLLPSDVGAQNSGVISSIVGGDLVGAGLRAARFITGGSVPRVVDAEEIITAAMVDPSIRRGFVQRLSGTEMKQWVDRLVDFGGRSARTIAAPSYRALLTATN